MMMIFVIMMMLIICQGMVIRSSRPNRVISLKMQMHIINDDVDDDGGDG